MQFKQRKVDEMQAMFNVKRFHEIKWNESRKQIKRNIDLLNALPKNKIEEHYNRLSDITKAYIKLV